MKTREAVAATMAFLFAKPEPSRVKVEPTIRAVNNGQRAGYYAMLKRGVPPVLANEIDSIVTSHSLTYAVPKAVVYAVMETESDFRPGVVSPGGDLGLMQVRLATAKKCLGSVTRSRVLTPSTNIHVGVWYIRSLHNEMVAAEIEGENEYHASIIAYNAGPSAARRAMAGRGTVGLKYYAKIRKAIAKWQKELA